MSKRTRYAKASFTRESVELITSLQFTRPRLEASSPRSGLRLARRRRTPALPLAAPPNRFTAAVCVGSARRGTRTGDRLVSEGETLQGCQPLSLSVRTLDSSSELSTDAAVRLPRQLSSLRRHPDRKSRSLPRRGRALFFTATASTKARRVASRPPVDATK